MGLEGVGILVSLIWIGGVGQEVSWNEWDLAIFGTYSSFFKTCTFWLFGLVFGKKHAGFMH